MTTVPQRLGQTDGQTDDLRKKGCDSKASSPRGKNCIP